MGCSSCARTWASGYRRDVKEAILSSNPDNATEPLDNNGQMEKKRAFEQLLLQLISDEWRSLSKRVIMHIKKFKLASENNLASQMAQDVIQDAFVIALEKAQDYNPANPIGRWFFYIAFNCIRHLHREKVKEHRHISLVSDAVSALNKRSTTDTQAISEADMLDRLNKAQNRAAGNQATLAELLSLTAETDREILRLAFEEELQGKDLAARFGISEGAARVRLFRAIARLREAYLGSDLSRGKEQ
jgi:RNA polymerase sigma factor (sigma-70 family)